MIGTGGPDLSRSYFSPLTDAYSSKTSLGTADTGQAWWTLDNGAAGASLSVVAGKLTNVATLASAAAGYIETNVGGTVASIGGQFTLGAGGAGGIAVFIVWRRLFSSVTAIPDASCHLTIGKSGWGYGVWQSSVLSSVATGSLSLTADGATAYDCTVTFAGSTATLTISRGGTALVDHTAITDARIASMAGPFVCFEVYQGNAATDAKPAFTEVHAST